MPEPLAKEDLDKAQCDTSECTEKHGSLTLHVRCHMESPTWATYSNGILTIKCATCEKVGAKILVGLKKDLPS